MSPSPRSGRNMRLGDLLDGFAETAPHQDVIVSGLAQDSRRVAPGDVFFALTGNRFAGLDFVRQAAAAGAVAIVSDQSRRVDAGLPQLVVDRLALHLGEIASRFYDHPSRHLSVTGVTGTNGKTSCSQFLAQALDREPGGCGVIGTLGYGRVDRLQPASHTTPDAITLQQQLGLMRESGLSHVVMEVSSHALDQGRVNGTEFNAAIFTNLSHDHLDYHHDMETYGRAKRRLFEMPALRYAVINADDSYGHTLLDTLPAHVRSLGYSLVNDQRHAAGRAEIRGHLQQLGADGMTMTIETPWGQGILASHLFGRFNARNLLAVLGTLLLLGIPFDEALKRLADTRSVAGRMEHLGGESGQPLVVIDYAHTPDALQQALETVREHCRGHVYCVFGCGGERDRHKRPVMGRVAAQLADMTIITDDNPRGEDADRIVEEILAGMDDRVRVSVIRDRAAAIATAVQQAATGDVVLIAGKGHEDYQLVGQRRIHFSDRQQAEESLKRMAYG